MNIPAGNISHAAGVYHLPKADITCAKRQISLRSSPVRAAFRIKPLRFTTLLQPCYNSVMTLLQVPFYTVDAAEKRKQRRIP